VRAKLPPGKPLLRVLCDLAYVSDEELRRALKDNRLSVGIGALLVELGYLEERELNAALNVQKSSPVPKKLGEVLIEQSLIEEHKLLEILAIQLGFPHAAPDSASVDRALLQKTNPRWCAQHLLVPLRAENGGTMVAMADPLDRQAREEAVSLFGAEIIIAIASKRDILDALASADRNGRPAQPEAATADSDVIGLVNSLIVDALLAGASDIHVEPLKSVLRVRFRCDGVLVPYKELDKSLVQALTSRVKIMAKIDTSEKRRHQDGRIHFEDPETGQSTDIRISVYTTLNGQKIVMRLLSRKAQLLDIKHVGLAPRMMERFLEDALDAPSGVILITGPTGSGKTTTLYGALNYLNNDETCIITAEDPVEYVIEGIAQCSINPQLNLTFEETLRHMVRQDPDVIVLGEIRDKFSAETAIQAALTGHKVLTTFHTEDTVGGLLRLMNMNIETFLISSTVVSVLAQRLLRRVCPHCAQPYQPSAADLRRLGYSISDLAGSTFKVGQGCARCRFTGYSGRVGVFELLVLNEAVKNALLTRCSSYDIRRVSMETSGLVTLLEDGIVKASRGHTTLAEVLRNLPKLEKPRPLAELRRNTGA
jgi:type IV pilus assembly protein PilB